MNGATAAEGHDSLEHPTNQILAIFDRPAAAQAAVAALNAAGFTPADIGLLSGPGDAAKFDAASGQQGPFAQLLSGAAGLGDEEENHVGRYRQALLDGGATVSVKAKERSVRDQVQQILTAHGGHFINFYGRLTVEGLEA